MKIRNTILGCLLASALLFTGCNLTVEQSKVIALNAGLGAAVTWIAYDNPDQAAKTAVVSTLDVIQTNAVNVKSGMTYTSSIYPEVQRFVSGGSVQQNYIPLALAGSLSLLNGIDLLMITNPKWKENQDLALDIVDSFITGARTGLALSSKDARVIQAQEFNSKRARIFKQ